MKKLITGLVLMLVTTVSYAIEFECTGFYNDAAVGKPIKVNAAKEIVADTKAKSRFQKAGLKVDYVRCK